ncbi:MAG TPA: hypothetical protein EYH06_08485 [Chromatiales bacterium]|nr:hypothetical protein [Chromatiales bacterium]
MKRAYPLIAFAMGLTIVLALFGLHSPGAGNAPKLPLLTALLMAEFGFLVNAAAVIFGVQRYFSGDSTKTGMLLLPVNFLLALYLLVAGFKLWPGFSAG